MDLELTGVCVLCGLSCTNPMRQCEGADMNAWSWLPLTPCSAVKVDT